ncbi:hypothetical protein BXY39_0893 [Eilatimonas milleporae]|uniref:Uncharacterized protein n=1 Tax=Eilatimonas milleporae TaxID=911205 RepID=A0A3M0CTL1_9PROT|nr:hypothetical protein BXY39_0893 [Eilatimonas milleporae]
MCVTVTADLYSGRPNPSWDVTGDTAERVAGALRALPPGGDPAVRPPGLGYRGMRAEIVSGDGTDVWCLYGGTARHGDGLFTDRGRAAERMLIDTGTGTLTAASLTHISGTF